MQHLGLKDKVTAVEEPVKEAPAAPLEQGMINIQSAIFIFLSLNISFKDMNMSRNKLDGNKMVCWL